MLQINTVYHILSSNLDMGVMFFIALFLTTSIILILSLIYKRGKQIRKTKLIKLMQAKVDDMLFQYLFTNSSFEDLIKNSDYAKYQKDLLFQKITVKAIITLRNNYTGEYRIKLNQLYSESGLAENSYKNLNSKKWPDNVEGIRNLSNMNVQEAYPKIEQFLNHKNNMVRTEAIVGMIKLKGINELVKIANSDIYLDDWTQSNILYFIQNDKIGLPSNIVDLLYCNNLSIVLLAIRSINCFNSTEHIKSLNEYINSASDEKITSEIVQTLKNLNEYNNQIL